MHEDQVIKDLWSSPLIPDYKSHFEETERTYSWRNAAIGSTRDALRAGMKLAAAATPTSSDAATRVATGSTAPISNSVDEIKRVAASAIGAPIAIPALTSQALSLNAIRNTSARVAPSAMRTPISRVRRETE